MEDSSTIISLKQVAHINELKEKKNRNRIPFADQISHGIKLFLKKMQTM